MMSGGVNGTQKMCVCRRHYSARIPESLRKLHAAGAAGKAFPLTPQCHNAANTPAPIPTQMESHWWQTTPLGSAKVHWVNCNVIGRGRVEQDEQIVSDAPTGA